MCAKMLWCCLKRLSSSRGLMLLLFFASIYYLDCAKEKKSDAVVLARVGAQIITVDDFRYNYEFGLPHLKKAPDRKRSYLDFMIREMLLALEGRNQGLDKSDRIQQLENELTEELLVEALFKKEVHDKINVAPEDIKEAITKSKVKWKLRYWAEPTLDYANSVHQAMLESGYGAVVGKILAANPEVKIRAEDFTTDYMTWLDVPPEIMDAIKDLEQGEISMPVEMNGVYFIFQMVNILREPLTELELMEKAGTYKKILVSRKVNDAAARFVSDFMTPKNVVTKGEAFHTMSEALIAWNKTRGESDLTFSEAVEAEKDQKSALFKLRDELDKTLLTFENGQWTIKDFLDRFKPKSIKYESTDVTGYRKALNQEIALTIRDHFFTREARQKKLHKTPSIQQEVAKWRDKWLYEAMRNSYTQQIEIDDQQAREYFSKFKDKFKTDRNDIPRYAHHKDQAKHGAFAQRARSILQRESDSLKTVYPVYINEAVLDTITVIDFQKSRWISLQVFKQGSNRLAHPIADPAWGF